MDPDQLLVDLVVGALRLPGAPRDHGSHAGELEDREQGEQRAEGASGAAARQGPSCVTWRVVHDNGSSPLPAAPQQSHPVHSPTTGTSLARLMLEPQLLLLTPQQQQQQQQRQAQTGQDQEPGREQLPWGLLKLAFEPDAAADDLPLDQQLAAPPEVWVRRGGRFLPVRVRQLQEAVEAGGGAVGAGGGGTTGVTVLEVQLLGQPPAAGVAMVDLVWPCGLCRCMPLLLTRQEAVAAEAASALGLPYGHVGVRHDNVKVVHQDTEDLIMDLGMWEEALDQLQEDTEVLCGSDTSSLRCPLDPAELRVLSQDLVAYAEECGWGRTAAWVRQGLEQLQGWSKEGEGQQGVKEAQRERQHEEGQQGGGSGQAGEPLATGPLVGCLRCRPSATSQEQGGDAQGGEAGTRPAAGAGGAADGGKPCKEWPRAREKRATAKPQDSSHDHAPEEHDGGSSPLEQAFHVAATLLLLLLAATRGLARPALLTAQYLSLGPGALITLSRLLLPHATWSRAIA